MAKKLAIGCGALLALIVITSGIGFVIVDAQYGLTAAPAVSHEDVLSRTADIRIAVQPRLGGDLVQNAVMEIVPGTPPMVIDAATPRQFAMTFAISERRAQFDVTMFVNPTRFAPVIAQTLSTALLSGGSSALTWAPPGITEVRPGVLEARGTYQLDDAIVEEWERGWELDGRAGTLPFTNQHLVEINLDNHRGLFFILFKMIDDPSLGDSERKLILDAIRAMSYATITIDPFGEEEFEIVVKAFMRDNAPEGSANAIRNLISFAVLGGKSELNSRYGLTMEGTVRNEGDVVEGRYRIGPRAQLIAVLLGTNVTTP